MKDLKIIKKYYGEAMMHFCRDNFSSILEEEGTLSNIILSHFEPNHNLYFDLLHSCNIQFFEKYIYSLIKKESKSYDTSKSPKELMSDAGYILYECKNEKAIQKFKKYYAKGEELCTFNGGRLRDCYVFFAVKKDVDKIKREDFSRPQRQDLYGTSVISIQFTRDDSHTLSIKNRYNHTVSNPDATYSNNLDNIIEGLTNSFEQFYGLVQKYKEEFTFEIPNYVKANNGKYYKYNYEVSNKYYCPNNIVIDNYNVKHYEKEKYLLFDYFILDLQNKKIEMYDKNFSDAFLNDLQYIKDIKIENKEYGKLISILPETGDLIEIELDKENNIIGYKNNNIIKTEKYFLANNKKLKKLECNNLEYIESYFLADNKGLTEINLPNAIVIKDAFIYKNVEIEKINLPQVKEIESHFLHSNIFLEDLILPNVIYIENCFLYKNKKLKSISLPSAKKIGDGFLCENTNLIAIDMPVLNEIGEKFLYHNNSIKTLILPCVTRVKEYFLGLNNSLQTFSAPSLITMYYYSLYYNKKLRKIILPKLKHAELCLVQHPFIRVDKIIRLHQKRERVIKK